MLYPIELQAHKTEGRLPQAPEIRKAEKRFFGAAGPRAISLGNMQLTFASLYRITINVNKPVFWISCTADA